MDEMRDNRGKPRNASVDGLTGIPHRIHWPATQDCGGSESHELDLIAIDNLLNVFAEIAISIAARGARQGKEEADDESSI